MVANGKNILNLKEKKKKGGSFQFIDKVKRTQDRVLVYFIVFIQNKPSEEKYQGQIP